MRYRRIIQNLCRLSINSSEMYPVMLNSEDQVPTNVIPAFNSEFVQIVN